AFQKAIECDPQHAPAHSNLGAVLDAKNDFAGAIACYRKALAADPQYAPAHNNLGSALIAQGKVDEAIACFRAALKAEPKFAEAHCNLGRVLFKEGRFADALGPLKQGHALGSPRPGWRYPSDRWVKECESLLAVDRKLPAVLKGAEIANTSERLQLAQLCQQY